MFEDKEEKAREEIIDYALKLSRAGLNVNSSGNLSVRFDSPESKGFLITPTGLPYDETEPEDLVRILFTDNGCYKAVGSRQPSSEWNLHAFLYQARPDINAVVHTHSPYATMGRQHNSVGVGKRRAVKSVRPAAEGIARGLFGGFGFVRRYGESKGFVIIYQVVRRAVL